MKKLIYTLCLGAAILSLSSCSGKEEYDAYLADLQAQSAAIDTISSPESYANTLDTLALKADEFDQLGLKLTDSQKEEIAKISDEIQSKLNDKYNSLAQTPVALPDDNVILEADAPVDGLTEPGATPELQ